MSHAYYQSRLGFELKGPKLKPEVDNTGPHCMAKIKAKASFSKI